MAKSFDLPLEERRADGRVESDRPRAVVLKLLLPDDPSLLFPGVEALAEIRSLAQSAGLDIVGSVIQKRRRPHPGTYAGKGKLGELSDLADRLDANVILVDDPISPSQGKAIEERTDVRVIDRAELILDIFATRASSHQARLQVELAQLRYSQSRLTRMWTHLSRMEGGIGMRGPGETQLETDRRIIRRKISFLKEKLSEIEQQHATQNKARSDAFKIALVGYTNAGKSTLMRRLTGAPVLVENRLFSTLDTSTRRWDLDCGRDVLLSDTVGFIRKLPHTLVASFHATLMEAREADLLLHVVDGSSPQVEHDLEVVDTTLETIGCGGEDRIVVFNKVDQLTEDRLIDLRHLTELHVESCVVSATEGTGIGQLLDRILATLSQRETVLSYRLPLSRGDLASRLRKLGSLDEERYEPDHLFLRARLLPEDRDRFHRLLEQEGLADAIPE